MADPLAALQAALADRYRVECELGHGGMATVYLAQDLKNDRTVALKVLRPELAAALGPERFLREVRITARLNHPHILPLLASGEANGLLYYAMPYVEGESLRDRLKREKQLPLDDALQIAREVADALSYAHGHNVVHRDIKPENVLLESGHAVVADFGIARAITAAGGDRLTETGIAMGTPAYMSPEQASGSTDLDGRSDLYSLGCMLYEMLAGRPPFVGPTQESILHQHLAAEPPSITSIRPAVPGWVAAALSRALAKTPADRFNPVAVFGEALRAAPLTGSAEVRPRRGRRRLTLAVSAIAILGAGAWVARAMFPRSTISPVLIGQRRPFTIVAAVSGSADPEVRKTARTVIMTALDQSSFVAPLPDDQVRQGLALAGRSDTTTLTQSIARELAVRGSIRTMIAAAVDRLGQVYHVAIQAIDADSGTTIVTERAVARTEDDLIPALDRVVQTVRKALGEQASAVSATRPVRSVATSSFEAYQAYRRGRELFEAVDYARARPALEDAVARDPDFGEARRTLAVLYRNQGIADTAILTLRQALERPTIRFTERNRLNAEGLAAWWGGDPTAALPLIERAVRDFGSPPINLAVLLGEAGKAEESVALLQSWIQTNPFGGSNLLLVDLAEFLADLRRYDDARKVVKQMSGPVALNTSAAVEMAAGNWTVAESAATGFLRQPFEVPALRKETFTCLGAAQAVRGRLVDAFANLSQAGNYVALAILTAAAEGHPTGSGPRTNSGPVSIPEALWAIAVGDATSARHYLEQERAIPRRAVRDTALTLLEGRLAFAAGRWSEAVQILRPLAAQTRYRGPPTNQLTRWTMARAFEEMGSADSAVRYFEDLAEWRSYWTPDIRFRGLTHSFAHQHLVVLYARMGRLEDARRHWKILSETFTNPDPEVRHLIDEARAALMEAERRSG